MVVKWGLLLLGLGLALAGVNFQGAARAQTDDGKPPVSVDDLVRVSSLGDPMSPDATGSGSVVHLSPSAARAAVILRYGNAENNSNIGSLYIFRLKGEVWTRDEKAAVTFASSSNFQPLALLRWIDESTVIFVASDGDQLPQIYELNIDDGKLVRLTHESSAILDYALALNGKSLVLVSDLPSYRPEDAAACIQTACLIKQTNLFYADMGYEARHPNQLVAYDLSVGQRRQLWKTDDREGDVAFCYPKLLGGGASPDGRFVVRACVPELFQYPAWWRRYRVNRRYQDLMKQGNGAVAESLFVTDLESGATTRVGDTPFWGGDIYWLGADHEFAIAMGLQSLKNVSEKEAAARADSYAVLLFDAEVGGYRALTSWSVADASDAVFETPPSDKFIKLNVSRYSGRPVELQMHRAGDKWALTEGALASVQKPSTPYVEQSFDQRPRLVVKNTDGGEQVLIDPDDWLDSRTLGRIESTEFHRKDGRTIKAIVYYPPRFAPGKRYPLVIQTHGVNESKFSLNGISRNFPGEALAAKDIVVAQVQENIDPSAPDTDEWKQGEASYEAVIDGLVRSGVADRDRVGIQAWSRTGGEVAYMEAFSKQHLAAAMFINSATYGIWDYLSEGSDREIEASMGASPYGSGLPVWQRESADFNANMVRTPTLIGNSDTLFAMWNWYSALRHFDVPAEYWFFAKGSHDLFQVRHRIQFNQLVVDWFDYWLNGREDLDPTKREQYERWEEMCSSQIRRDKEHVTFCKPAPRRPGV